MNRLNKANFDFSGQTTPTYHQQPGPPPTMANPSSPHGSPSVPTSVSQSLGAAHLQQGGLNIEINQNPNITWENPFSDPQLTSAVQRGMAEYGRRGVRLQYVGHQPYRVRKNIIGRNDGQERRLCQGTMSYLPARGRPNPADFAHREGREVVVEHEPLAILTELS